MRESKFMLVVGAIWVIAGILGMGIAGDSLGGLICVAIGNAWLIAHSMTRAIEKAREPHD